GGAVPMGKSRKRMDAEQADDISSSNLCLLRKLGSPRVAAGRYYLFDPGSYNERTEVSVNPLDYMAPPKASCANTPPKGCMFVLESFRRHMDNGRWLFQLGMETQGYLSVGGGVPPPGVDSVDVSQIMDRHHPNIVIFWPRYEWDPQEWGGTEVLDEHCFRNWECLAEMPEVLRVVVFHDAGSARRQQRRWHEALRPHLYLTWYHPQSVVALAPHIREDQILRTYHVIDRDFAPRIMERDGVAVVSGAYVPDIYPLRTRAALAAQNGSLGPGIGLLSHPGYSQTGSTSNAYMTTLSRYRVALCTASSYRFALRKIFEATVAGCRVVTDLPDYDFLQGIDGNLVRIPQDTDVSTLREIFQREADEWNLERQKYYASEASRFYDWRVVSEQLATQLCERRKDLLTCPTTT
ncbi:MAG: hypothetical protein ABIH23_11080, partial [bacterium]